VQRTIRFVAKKRRKQTQCQGAAHHKICSKKRRKSTQCQGAAHHNICSKKRRKQDNAKVQRTIRFVVQSTARFVKKQHTL
jgi:hypothetical protein